MKKKLKKIKQSEDSKLEEKGVSTFKILTEIKDLMLFTKKNNSLQRANLGSMKTLELFQKNKTFYSRLQIYLKKLIPPLEEDKGEVVGLEQERMRGVKSSFPQSNLLPQSINIYQRQIHQNLGKNQRYNYKKGNPLPPHWPILKVK